MASDDYAYKARTADSGGRPRFIITEEQIDRLFTLGFSQAKMCELLGVSASTLYRNIVSLGIDKSYAAIPDENIDALVLEYRGKHKCDE